MVYLREKSFPLNELRLRICAVHYLNTVPLVWGLEHGTPVAVPFDLEFAAPAICAERVGAGLADIGLVPVAEVFRQGMTVVSDVGIACDGAVRSILLVSREPWDRVRRVAVDASSRSSVGLLRALLALRVGAEPEFLVRPPSLEPMLAEADAALLIGDAALRLDPDTLPYRVYDLGAEWKAWTGLPMVFAVWAARPGLDLAGWRDTFTASLEAGERAMEEIVVKESGERGFDAGLVRRYLGSHIVFRLGERHREGMRRYRDCLEQLEARTGASEAIAR